MSDLRLFDTLDTIRSIGKIKARALSRLGLNRIMDALFFFPRDYEDHSQIKAINELRDEDQASVIGEVVDFELVEKWRGRSTFCVWIQQGNHVLRGIWFNQAFRAKNVTIGATVMLSGKAKVSGVQPEMTHPKMVSIEEGCLPQRGAVLPVYRLTDGIKQAELRRWIGEIVTQFSPQVEEIFPAGYLAQKNLLEIRAALQQIHRPENPEEIEPARNRFVYQELLMLQLAIQLRRIHVNQQKTAPAIETNSRIDSRIKKYFPYELTAAQEKAIQEISGDMAKQVPMNRMLHGDVGCGKTTVAVYALLLAVAKGQQGVLMAPTETLARQHFRYLQTLLRDSQVQVELLVGGLGKKEKENLLAKIEQGQPGITIGTQALIQNQIHLPNLGLVIVDEQHRFGVNQRASLRQKGVTPHYLVMTATPIPRTVTMTLFGDLDVSKIDQRPPNQTAVNTYLCEEPQKEKWWDFVRKKLREGRQAYVVAPLVDDDEASAWASVEETFESLANGEFSDFTIDLVHGKQPGQYKEAAMQKFANGETQVLVATSVVEVGIDVPNATVMTILSANRFGLAQLHQLRGRVCRGRFPGYVTLFAETEVEETQERLQALVDTNDGFELAEIDFQLRGPGDLFGTRQHGIPPLFVANLQRDYDLLVETRSDAQHLLKADPGLDSEEFSEVKKRVLARYGKTLELADVG
ncbi:MAG: ATP-dependent DNA helicase RecG [Planctomycetota bacterium]|nr:ATP-dependent DNA helicase RecG [Planctomycetota bacterium]